MIKSYSHFAVFKKLAVRILFSTEINYKMSSSDEFEEESCARNDFIREVPTLVSAPEVVKLRNFTFVVS